MDAGGRAGLDAGIGGEMQKRDWSRREFGLIGGAGLLAGRAARAQGGELTAGQVVDRIKRNIGVPWNDKSYRDTFKIGGPEIVVHGITSTFMATLDVLQRSVAAGNNMIVTHEPTFWSDADVVKGLTDDPIYKIKAEYGRRHNLAVFRFHDHWHARKPDGIFTGWNKALGWVQYEEGGVNQRVWNLPPTTLGAVAKHVAAVLESRSVRVIGDPNLRVAKVGRGGHELAQNMGALPQVDCLLISEAREWETFEYVRDTVQSGARKGAVIISHEAGEEADMDEFARWLRPFVPEVKIQFIPTRDQFWTV